MRGGGWFSNPAPASAPASEPEYDPEILNLKMAIAQARGDAEKRTGDIADLKNRIEQQTKLLAHIKERPQDFRKEPNAESRTNNFLNKEAPNLMRDAEARAKAANEAVEAAQKKYDDYLAGKAARAAQASRTRTGANHSTVSGIPGLPPPAGGRGRRRKSRRSRTQ